MENKIELFCTTFIKTYIRITDIWSCLYDSLKALISALVLNFLNNGAVVMSSWSVLLPIWL